MRNAPKKTTANTKKAPASKPVAAKPVATKPAAVEPKAKPAAAKKVASKAQKAQKPKAQKVAKVAGQKRERPQATPGIERPTRNRTAYLMYVKDNRKPVQAKHPEMDFVTVTRHIADNWKLLTDAQRKTFEARAIKDKERYDAEVAQFRADHPGEPLTIKKKKRIVKLKGPKNARSAYVFYTKEHRQTIQTQNPDSDFGTITKMIADSWNALNAAQKVKFDKLAEADRVRFEAENKAFNQEHPEVKRRKVRAKKGAPKKPRSAYLFYTMEKRASFKAANPEMDFGALTKLVADDWGKLSAAQKKKFEKLAEDDKARHADELKNYVAPTDEELDAAEPVHKKKRVGPKRPRSAYLFFTVAERPKVMAEDASLKFGDVTKKIAETWNALSAREKSKFEDQAKADQERYNLECEAAAAQ